MPLWKHFPILVICLFIAACSSMGAKRDPLRTVEKVDLERFAGDWYVIANIPYFAEKGDVGGRVNYRPRPDGRFDDEYYYKKKNFDGPEKRAKGIAWILDENNTHWRSRFIWPFTFDFYIIGLDDDYQTLALGHPSRKYGWIMARTSKISKERYQDWLSKFTENGYHREQFFKVPQSPDDLGKEGFQ